MQKLEALDDLHLVSPADQFFDHKVEAPIDHIDKHEGVDTTVEHDTYCCLELKGKLCPEALFLLNVLVLLDV